MVWLARAQAHTVYLCMRFVAGICDFFVDSFENCPMLSSLSARACGGKVGAGTVEAEEDTYMGEWVCGFVLLSARADNAV